VQLAAQQLGVVDGAHNLLSGAGHNAGKLRC